MTVKLPQKVKELMPFGKHLGEYVEDVPTSYLNWLVQEGNLSGNLKKVIEKELETRPNGEDDFNNDEFKEVRFE